MLHDSKFNALVRAIVLHACWLTAGGTMATPPAPPLEFDAVRSAVEQYFHSLEGYQAGDLIARSHIRGALEMVSNAGWQVPEADSIAQLGLADSSFLVVRLSTPSGRRFMRRVADDQGAYARLDRLSSISGGQALVNDLIRRKGGDEFVRYLATKHGRQLGAQASATRQGVDLNRPTGRIYTADDLIAALRQMWDRAASR
jgi:hypothetical protein